MASHAIERCRREDRGARPARGRQAIARIDRRRGSGRVLRPTDDPMTGARLSVDRPRSPPVSPGEGTGVRRCQAARQAPTAVHRIGAHSIGAHSIGARRLLRMTLAPASDRVRLRGSRDPAGALAGNAPNPPCHRPTAWDRTRSS